MKIRTLLAFMMLNAVLFTACKKKDDSTPADTTPPVISLNGSSTVSVALGGPYSDAGATATDNVDGTVSVTSNFSGTNPNVSANGIYTITYTATDKAGNVGKATRTVSVGFNRADYIWPNGYSAVDADITNPSLSGTFTGYPIIAGVGANDIQIQYFNYGSQTLFATVNGSVITLNPSSQTFYPYIFTGSGSLNAAKNKITLNLHDSYQNHDHTFTLTKQ